MKSNRALVLTSVASMVDQFLLPSIKLLKTMGYSVDVAANFDNPGNITEERALKLKNKLEAMSVKVYDVPIPRTLNLILLAEAYKAIKSVFHNTDYALVHCHSPIGGALCRLAAAESRKRGAKVVYTAHGFHFYRGAPMLNWAVYYPVEWLLSWRTDILVTINREDYDRALRHLHARRTVYVPGVGIDTHRFGKADGGKHVREELDLGSSFVLLSVGELNVNKNHEAVIRAIAGLDVAYVVVGSGSLEHELKRAASQSSVRLVLPGYRTDVADFYNAADAFVLPSLREGLNVSLMEAMAAGLPCLASRIRGNVDLIDEGEGGLLFDPTRILEIRAAVEALLHANRSAMGVHNQERVREYRLEAVNQAMRELYAGASR